MRRKSLALIGILAFSAAVLAQAPQQRPVFRAGVDLVQVDVVVLDAQGQPVRGLTKDDFTLFDRGAQQEIAAFAAKSHERPPADPFAAPLPADVADNHSAKSDRLVIIVLDDLHFRSRREEAVALVRRTVNELGDSVSLGLVTTSGTFGVEVTEDRARLLTAIEQFLDRFDPARAKIPQVTVGPPVPPPPPGTPMEPNTLIPIRYSGRDLASDYSPLNTYKTVEDVARMAGANDGRRKAFVWISAGVEGTEHGNATFLDTCKNLKGPGGTTPPSAGDHISMRICGMYEKLFRSSVAVYSVSPGGPTYGASGRSLGDITKETGGFSIRASDMDAGMTRLITDLDNYYLLGFYPADQGRAGYRPIEVRVNRPGLSVRHRAGYHSAGPVPPPRNASPLGSLVAQVSPKSDLHLRLSAIPFFTTGSSMQLLTTVEVDLGALPAATADGLVRDELQFAVFAVDLNKKKVTRSAGRRVLIDWPQEHRARPGAGRFLLQTVLTVPPGSYQLRASTTSKTPETSGSVYLQVDVPDTRDRPIGISGILLGTAAADAPRVVEQKPLTGLTVPFAPSLDREFKTSEPLSTFFQVRRKNSKTAVEGFVTLMDPTGFPVAQAPWAIAPGAPGAVALRLPLAGIAPGAYRVVVSATSGQDVAAHREVRIRVVSGS
jgi:VWFA-related protein